jgi:predicted XRE-type DNA-binding protein
MSEEPVQSFASVWDALEKTPEAAAQIVPRGVV